ncbi:hypothetical protein [Pseudooceanicola spongiae]|uniref:Uncharacterized protein n=1 Tax=Pseudooceanicola spongiae TaxID=2613965 RepID=A0A7L9WNS6_9RHOB|nr:hypothetical protein [Pseudooceanicola spongiae]QOL80750.1 hypothetical protein F3W81_07940 [Pseudooceanicola spongiae]
MNDQIDVGDPAPGKISCRAARQFNSIPPAPFLTSTHRPIDPPLTSVRRNTQPDLAAIEI